MKCAKSLIAFLLLACTVSADPVAQSAHLRMNQIQVIGSHNSYHAQPSEPLFSLVKEAYPAAANWAYDHPALNVQLERGVRSFELDLYFDPEAIKVLHVPRFDQNSTCNTLVDCATVLRDWSKAHRDHVPVIVLLELKEDDVPQSNIPVLPFDQAALIQLERSLNDVFAPEQLIRPDDVRGDAATLREAVTTTGWPKLDAMRGRFLFVLHTGGAAAENYTALHPGLKGATVFLQAHGDEDHAAIYVLNNPTDPDITTRVKDGFIVRTRADANLKEAVDNDTTRREAALASGAQIITTDFFEGSPHKETGYVVRIGKGQAARVNVVNGGKSQARHPG